MIAPVKLRGNQDTLVILQFYDFPWIVFRVECRFLDILFQISLKEGRIALSTGTPFASVSKYVNVAVWSVVRMSVWEMEQCCHIYHFHFSQDPNT